MLWRVFRYLIPGFPSPAIKNLSISPVKSFLTIIPHIRNNSGERIFQINTLSDDEVKLKSKSDRENLASDKAIEVLYERRV